MLLKKGRLRRCTSGEADKMYDIPDGIIAHLTRECGGNVDGYQVVEITCGCFEKETEGANPHSGALDDCLLYATENAADLDVISRFVSAYHEKEEDILHSGNNWLCYNFEERRAELTHHTIRMNGFGPGQEHMKSWFVETSADGESWQEVVREEDNKQLNGRFKTGTFALSDGGECRFIPLVTSGKNYMGDDQLRISAWEVLGKLVESTVNSSDVGFLSALAGGIRATSPN
jgi:hypothetical protein